MTRGPPLTHGGPQCLAGSMQLTCINCLPISPQPWEVVTLYTIFLISLMRRLMPVDIKKTPWVTWDPVAA